MMNPFPLMFLSLIAFTILRIVAGLILLYLAWIHWQKRDIIRSVLHVRFPTLANIASVKLPVVEAIAGLMFIAGFYTQIAAIVAVLYSLKMLLLRRTLAYPLFPQPLFYILLIGVSVSLFITGAGAFAFDLPI